MFFSFVLPAYKGQYLSESIQSILNQTYEDFELVVVDDCSPDPIKEIVSQFHDDRIRYFRNDVNIGGKDLVAQWNYCLTFAKGDYVTLATDDDLYEPDFLSEFVPLINKYPSVGVFRGRIIDIGRDGKILWFDRCYKEFLNHGELFYYFFQGMKGGIPQYIFKKNELICNGGFVRFPMAWGSDEATALKLACNGIVNSQNMLVRFRWSDVNISNNKSRKFKRLKLNARIQLCQWLRKEIKHVEFAKNDIGMYCREYVVCSEETHIKQILIKELRTADIRDVIQILIKLYKEKVVSSRSIMSIIYRLLKV